MRIGDDFCACALVDVPLSVGLDMIMFVDSDDHKSRIAVHAGRGQSLFSSTKNA